MKKKEENYRLEGMREGMRDREKVMGRRGEAKGTMSQLTGRGAKQ